MERENNTIKIFETPFRLAEEFAKKFKEICDEVISKNGIVNVALSGGNTPKILFSEFAKDYKDKIDWSKVNFYWVDERCVLPDDEDSNFGMTDRILFKNISIPGINIHRIIGESKPSEEAKRYSELLKKNIPAKNNFPRLDLIILGMGEDGHTASIFPNQMELLNSEKICEVAIHPITNQKRITLTGKVINNAERIYFLVTGKGKAEVVAKILEKKEDYLKYPAAHVEPEENKTYWYLDSESASGLNLSGFNLFMT